MEQQLKTVFEAQKVCTQIIANEKKISSVPKRMHEIEATLAELVDRVERGNNVVEELDKDRRNKEKEIVNGGIPGQVELFASSIIWSDFFNIGVQPQSK